jgi:hypothetical protein
MLAALGGEGGSFEGRWLTPGERGRDDLRLEDEGDASLLAFLHLSEKVAAARFEVYRDVVADEETREVFRRILRDEVFHMRYTRIQLERIAPERHRRELWLLASCGWRARRDSGRATCVSQRHWPAGSVPSSSSLNTSSSCPSSRSPRSGRRAASALAGARPSGASSPPTCEASTEP